ncbi:MAG: FadR/GntR family transcriptional regulator [Candidatus Limnocylindrales bacterium]
MALGLERIGKRPEPLATEIARRILDYLLAGHLEPGERIPSERHLAEALGVGRSVVREALKSITLLGLLEVRPGDGTFLRQADSELLPHAIEWGLLLGEQRVADLIEVRHHLEVLVAGLATDRATRDDLVMLRTYLENMRTASDTASFVSADLAFHMRMAEATANVVLLQIMASIRNLLRVWMERVRRSEADNTLSTSEHETILRALECGDAAAARTAMEIHMESATRKLAQTLALAGQSAAGCTEVVLHAPEG